MIRTAADCQSATSRYWCEPRTICHAFTIVYFATNLRRNFRTAKLVAIIDQRKRTIYRKWKETENKTNVRMKQYDNKYKHLRNITRKQISLQRNQEVINNFIVSHMF